MNRCSLIRVVASKKVSSARRCATQAASSSKQPHSGIKGNNSASLDVLGGFPSFLTALRTSHRNFDEVNELCFQSPGKFFRPRLVAYMSLCCNGTSELLKQQEEICYISEMIHTSSLVHDDIVDNSSIRRGSPSVCKKHGQKEAAFSGNYIMGTASLILSRLKNPTVTSLLCQVIEDLVAGELMQLEVKRTPQERLNYYLQKTHKKAASLMAHSCEAVSILQNESNDSRHNLCFEIGNSIGMAFQLADDLKDYLYSSSLMGKPTNADLKLGLATAPALFASLQYPELNSLITRRFSSPGDVEKAREIVGNSRGLEDTRILMHKYLGSVSKSMSNFPDSVSKSELLLLKDSIQTKV